MGRAKCPPHFIAAKKGVDKIVVEIKSFLDLSVINDFHDALGKYLGYRSALNKQNIEREWSDYAVA